MTTAKTEAAKDGGEPAAGPSVQGSWWSRIKSAASSVVGTVREGLSAIGSLGRRILDAAMSRVRGLYERARSAIGERIGRFVAAARDLGARFRDRLAAAGRGWASRIRNAVASARAALGRLVTRLRDFAVSVMSNLWSALRAAGSWLRDTLGGLVRGVIAAGRAVLAFAGRVRELLEVTGSKVITGLVRAVKDPGAFIAPYKAQVAGMIAQVPEKSHEMYDKHVAPLFGGGGRAMTAAAGPTAQRTVQRQESAPVQQQEEDAGPSHADVLWEYLKQRFAYLGGHWGSVILDVLLEIFVPFVSLWRHLPPMLEAVWQALKDLFAGRFSDAIDAGLKAARELMAILSTLFAQASIAAFIAGSIIGTPIVGEGAMLAIGLSLLAADVVVQGASIAKAWSNVNKPDRTAEKLDEDYSVMSDGIVSLGITLALILIAAVGQKLAKVLVARFPRAGAAAAALKARIQTRVRKALGIEDPRPAGPVVDRPNAPSIAPEATDFPGRAGLNAAEQRAFDRTIAARRANGSLTPEFEARLKTMTADQLRGVFRRQLDPATITAEEQAQAAQGRADATNQSDPLNPAMANSRDEGGNVRSRWNETPPDAANEVAPAQHISSVTGEPIELYGDGYVGIDGQIGRPPRPFQLKSPPQAGRAGAVEVYRNAVVAYGKARDHGFMRVETHIRAANVTRAEVAAEFARPTAPGVFNDGVHVSRVVVYCSDGVFVAPSGPGMVPPPVHIDAGQDDDRQPVGAGQPGG
jgi:hypothetical protein